MWSPERLEDSGTRKTMRFPGARKDDVPETGTTKEVVLVNRAWGTSEEVTTRESRFS